MTATEPQETDIEIEAIRAARLAMFIRFVRINPPWS